MKKKNTEDDEKNQENGAGINMALTSHEDWWWSIRASVDMTDANHHTKTARCAIPTLGQLQARTGGVKTSQEGYDQFVIAMWCNGGNCHRVFTYQGDAEEEGKLGTSTVYTSKWPTCQASPDQEHGLSDYPDRHFRVRDASACPRRLIPVFR